MTILSWKQYEQILDKYSYDYEKMTTDEREACTNFLENRNCKEASLMELALINRELGRLFKASYNLIHGYVDTINN